MKSEAFTTFSSYSLSIVPMFLLMGHFATLGGMSQALFKAAEGGWAIARVVLPWPPLAHVLDLGRSADHLLQLRHDESRGPA